MTINPKILEISNGTDLIEEWEPEYTRLFHIKITVVVRFEEEDMNLYYLDVATPDFIAEEKIPRFIKKLLIVDEYKKDQIIKFINNIIFEKNFESIEDCHNHIYEYFHWEFDNYYILSNE